MVAARPSMENETGRYGKLGGRDDGRVLGYDHRASKRPPGLGKGTVEGERDSGPVQVEALGVGGWIGAGFGTSNTRDRRTGGDKISRIRGAEPASA